MTAKLPKLKLKNPFSLKHFYLVAAILVIAVLIALGVFIYQYFYQTITQAKEIILLKSQVAPETINLDEVNKILGLLDKKITSDNINWPEIKNPFLPSAVNPAPAATTTPQ